MPRDIAVLVGSLRNDSLNRKAAKALARLAPDNLKLEIIQIGQLPRPMLAEPADIVLIAHVSLHLS